MTTTASTIFIVLRQGWRVEEYRGDSDVLGGVYKLLAALGATHPFAVVRVAELREWVDGGDYQRILDGDYRTNADDAETPYTEDLGDAAGGYAATVRKLADDVSGKIGNVTTRISKTSVRVRRSR